MLTKAEIDLVSSTAYLAALGDPKSYGLFVSGLHRANFMEALGESTYYRIVIIAQWLAWGEAGKGYFDITN